MEALKPCPFCGAPAEVIHLEGVENEGGSCVSCTSCFASSNVEFEFKENFVDNWNRRADPAPALLEALKEAQSVLAMMVEPGAIQQTTAINAYAAAKAAEAKARTAISQAEGGE